MNREIISGVLGFVAGALTASAIGYFGVYRKYIPLRQLEKEVGMLEDERREKLRKLDAIDSEYQSRSKEYEEKLTEYDKRLDAYDEEIESAKNELHDLRGVDVSEPAIRHDIIDDAFGERWNGPLNAEEQEKIDSCDGDELLEESMFTEIKESRFDRSIDVDRMIYYISMAEHDNRPDFIDEHILTYYQGDDVLADGRKIIGAVEELVDPKFFRYFKPGEDAICFRNDNYKIDFVIERSEGTYQNAIFGIGDENAYIPERKHNQEIAKEQ